MSKLMFNKNAVGGGSPTRAALVTYVEEDGQIVSVQDKIKNMEEVVSLTQAEYDALPGTKLTDNKLYLIQDADDEMDAYNITYKNTTVGDELDAQKQNLGNLSSASAVSGNDAFSKIKTLNDKLEWTFKAKIDTTSTTEIDAWANIPDAVNEVLIDMGMANGETQAYGGTSIVLPIKTITSTTVKFIPLYTGVNIYDTVYILVQRNKIKVSVVNGKNTRFNIYYR